MALPFYSQVFFYFHLALHRRKGRDAIEDKEEKSIRCHLFPLSHLPSPPTPSLPVLREWSINSEQFPFSFSVIMGVKQRRIHDYRRQFRTSFEALNLVVSPLSTRRSNGVWMLRVQRREREGEEEGGGEGDR